MPAGLSPSTSPEPDHELHSAAAQTFIAGSSESDTPATSSNAYGITTASPSAHTTAFPISPHVTRRATFDTTATNDRTSGYRNSQRVSTIAGDRTSKRASTYPISRLASRISVANYHDFRKRVSRQMSLQLTPEKPIGKAPGTLQGIKTIVKASWLNVLLIFIPVSWACNFALDDSNKSETLIFVFSFLAIIPLAKLLAFATDELSMRVGQTLAGLLNATLGNAVELIVAIIALAHCELSVVQSSLVGSILSNLLLVLGMCFFAGGVKFSEQGFGMSATQLNSSLLTVSVIAVLLPAAFHSVAGSVIADDTEGPDILAFSRGAAVILLFIYGSYLVFQLFSHKSLYEDNGSDVFVSTRYATRPQSDKPRRRWLSARFKFPRSANNSAEPLTPTAEGVKSEDGMQYEMKDRTGNAENEGDAARCSSPSSASGSERENLNRDVEAQRESDAEKEEEEETPQLNIPLTVALLVIVTVLVAVTAEWLVDSIDGLTDSGVIGKEFVGLILLPIVGNAAEHVTAVTVSVKDKLTLSLGVAAGSSIQIALFVIPFTVVLSWIMGKPLTMLFDPFESITLFLAVLVVNYTVQDGKSNWLEGMILMCLYVIIAVTFWYYPGIQISDEIHSAALVCS